MASGTIITQTRTSDAYLPVENATVAFYEALAQGNGTLLALRKTDASGKTAPVELETPNLADSQQPVSVLGTKPYRTVNIIADHPGFEQITVDGIQIFDGIITYQDIMLVPNNAYVPGKRPQEVFLTPGQNL